MSQITCEVRTSASPAVAVRAARDRDSCSSPLVACLPHSLWSYCDHSPLPLRLLAVGAGVLREGVAKQYRVAASRSCCSRTGPGRSSHTFIPMQTYNCTAYLYWKTVYMYTTTTDAELRFAPASSKCVSPRTRETVRC